MVRMMKRNEDEALRALDYSLQCFSGDTARLAELTALAEMDPDDQILADVVKALRTRIECVLKGIRSLNDYELNLLHLRYELHLTYREMENYVFYSPKMCQLKIRAILRKIVRNAKYIV